MFNIEQLITVKWSDWHAIAPPPSDNILNVTQWLQEVMCCSSFDQLVP